MNFRQQITLVLLFLGLLFSSIIRVRFNISDGFEYHNIWVTWIPAIFDFALLSSKEQALTTTFVGYIFFVSAGFLMLHDIKLFGHKNKRLTLFLALSVFALLFELLSLAEDKLGNYYGEHFHIGLVLFILGMIAFYQTFQALKIIKVLHHE